MKTHGYEDVNYLRSTTCIRIPIIISIHVLNVDPIGHVLTQNQHAQVLDEEQGPQGLGEDISGCASKCVHVLNINVDCVNVKRKWTSKLVSCQVLLVGSFNNLWQYMISIMFWDMVIGSYSPN